MQGGRCSEAQQNIHTTLFIKVRLKNNSTGGKTIAKRIENRIDEKIKIKRKVGISKVPTDQEVGKEEDKKDKPRWSQNVTAQRREKEREREKRRAKVRLFFLELNKKLGLNFKISISKKKQILKLILSYLNNNNIQLLQYHMSLQPPYSDIRMNLHLWSLEAISKRQPGRQGYSELETSLLAMFDAPESYFPESPVKNILLSRRLTVLTYWKRFNTQGAFSEEHHRPSSRISSSNICLKTLFVLPRGRKKERKRAILSGGTTKQKIPNIN
ncbi:hypothetical protein RUM43_008258 [Polyplax serrata]|uniref:Uncharacterized protein n=1 Tax=Polyplax serrata TaxID=468196 RepID=A0AAN8PNH3_POLSC